MTGGSPRCSPPCRPRFGFVLAIVAGSTIRALCNPCVASAGIALFAGTAAAQSAAPQNRADSSALLTALYRTALANGLRTAHAPEGPMLVCVSAEAGDPPEAILAALADSTPMLVRPRSACRVESLRSRSNGRSLVVDTLTGKRGIVISVDDLVFDQRGAFTFHTAYYENGRSAADWECIGRRTQTRWEVVSCRLTRIS